MITTNARWHTLFYATAAGLTLMWACRFTPNKPVIYKGTIDTEFDIPSGENFQLGAYLFNEDFELPSGTVGFKLSYQLPKSQVALAPQSLQLSMVHLDSTRTTVLQTYAYTLQGTMSPHGSNEYDFTYKFRSGLSPAFTFAKNDYLRMDLEPVGGTLGTGLHINVGWSYHPGKVPGGMAPIVTWFDPQSGMVGSHVTIDGIRLGGTAAMVKFNGTLGTVNFGDDMSIDCTVPTGATTGPISVQTSHGKYTTANAFAVQF